MTTTDLRTAAPLHPAGTRAAARPGTAKRLWRTGAVAGASAALATTATAALAEAADVPLTVGGKAIPLAGFAQLTVVATLAGVALAVVLARRAARPRRTFVVTTVALTAVSLMPDVLADATTATRYVLALTHVVAATIVIPALASRLSD